MHQIQFESPLECLEFKVAHNEHVTMAEIGILDERFVQLMTFPFSPKDFQSRCIGFAFKKS